MTWVRRHCIICAFDHEDCDICGCHLPVGSIENGHSTVRIDTPTKEAAPAGNQGLTAKTVKES